VTGIHAAIERNRRVYGRLVGGWAQAELPQMAQVQNRAAGNVFEWDTPEILSASGAAGGMMWASSHTNASHAEEVRWEGDGYSLSPAPPDLLETAELLIRTAEVEERFGSQNLEREER